MAARIEIRPQDLAPPPQRLVVELGELAAMQTDAANSDQLHFGRGESGRIVIGDKDEVYDMSSGQPDPNSDKVHWPVTSPIPSDPDKAFVYTQRRRAR